MSQTSCIRHPANTRFLKIYQWQLDFCDGNACAAALMSYFEFCHNGKLQQQGQAKTLNDALEKTPHGRTQSETLLQWHTTADLEKAVFFYKRDKISEAIKLLKSKEVIELHNNPIAPTAPSIIPIRDFGLIGRSTFSSCQKQSTPG